MNFYRLQFIVWQTIKIFKNCHFDSLQTKSDFCLRIFFLIRWIINVLMNMLEKMCRWKFFYLLELKLNEKGKLFIVFPLILSKKKKKLLSNTRKLKFQLKLKKQKYSGQLLEPWYLFPLLYDSIKMSMTIPNRRISNKRETKRLFKKIFSSDF